MDQQGENQQQQEDNPNLQDNQLLEQFHVQKTYLINQMKHPALQAYAVDASHMVISYRQKIREQKQVLEQQMAAQKEYLEQQMTVQKEYIEQQMTVQRQLLEQQISAQNEQYKSEIAGQKETIKELIRHLGAMAPLSFTSLQLDRAENDNEKNQMQ